MNKFGFIIVIFLFFIFCNAECKKNMDCIDGSHDRIEIRNNSNIAVNWMHEDTPGDSIWTVNGTYAEASYRLIDSNSSHQSGAGLSQCWESYYKNGLQEYYFIFHHDTIQAIGWQGVSGTNRGLLKKVRVDLTYLQNNNFTITFP